MVPGRGPGYSDRLTIALNIECNAILCRGKMETLARSVNDDGGGTKLTGSVSPSEGLRPPALGRGVHGGGGANAGSSTGPHDIPLGTSCDHRVLGGKETESPTPLLEPLIPIVTVQLRMQS